MSLCHSAFGSSVRACGVDGAGSAGFSTEGWSCGVVSSSSLTSISLCHASGAWSGGSILLRQNNEIMRLIFRFVEDL